MTSILLGYFSVGGLGSVLRWGVGQVCKGPGSIPMRSVGGTLRGQLSWPVGSSAGPWQRVRTPKRWFWARLEFAGVSAPFPPFPMRCLACCGPETTPGPWVTWRMYLIGGAPRAPSRAVALGKPSAGAQYPKNRLKLTVEQDGTGVFHRGIAKVYNEKVPRIDVLGTFRTLVPHASIPLFERIVRFQRRLAPIGWR
jgi:hypothetical protein